VPVPAEHPEFVVASYATQTVSAIAVSTNVMLTSDELEYLLEVDPDAWLRTVDINLAGTFVCARAVLPAMVAQRHGCIVNVASHAGVHRWPQVSAYAISKSAVIKFTENLAVETRRLGVMVFAVDPGRASVGLTEAVLNADVAEDSPAGQVAAWFRQQFAAGREVPPERAGQLVVTPRRRESGCVDRALPDGLRRRREAIERADEIQHDDLYTLRLRRLPPTTGAAARSAVD